MIRVLIAILVANLLAVGGASGGDFGLPSAVRKEVRSVVGMVGSTITNRDHLVEFHKDLAKRYSDTPTLEAFVNDEVWLSVMTSRGVIAPGIFSGRAKAALRPERGDIVKMRIAEYRDVDSYFKLSEVEAVVCRKREADYKECAVDHPLMYELKSGERWSEPAQP